MKIAWYSKKWVVVILHASAWLLLFSLPYLLRPSYNESQPAPVAKVKTTLDTVIPRIMDATWILLFYINALILVPKFIYNRKYWQYTGLQLLIFLWVMVQAYVLFNVVRNPEKAQPIGMLVLFNFFIYLFILASSTAYQMIRHKLHEDQLEKERENERLKTELSLLRSQVSPHFMFNVLNNMVSLARKHSDQLEPSLIKLSSLMRYMLYEAEDKVTLDKEIDYLQSYIDLQQQRFGKKVKVNALFAVNDTSYQVEPMLLIPFVENAFKHGTGMIEDAVIDIELTSENNSLLFSVRNKYNDAIEEVKDRTSGIGLPNVKRRLILLYGDEQQLDITRENNWFTVKLLLKFR